MNAFDWINKIWQTVRCTKKGALFAETIHVGYAEGKEFRIFDDFSLADGGVKVIKFVSAVNFAVHNENVSIVSGEMKMETLTTGTEGGTFTAKTVFPKNMGTERPTPLYESQMAVSSGGTHTGGTLLQVSRMKTSGNSNFAANVGKDSSDVRTYPAGTYYIRFTATGAVVGVYNLVWEERV